MRETLQSIIKKFLDVGIEITEYQAQKLLTKYNITILEKKGDK